VNGPRYKVAVVHGYRTLKTGSPHKVPQLAAHVLDRLNAHRVVATFRSEDKVRPEHRQNRPRRARRRGRDGAIAAATARAAEWNADEGY
jgi:hypothetical protein